jgi:hypothetical protein
MNMETSTLVLTALTHLNDNLLQDENFQGYVDDYKGTARLLDELWDLYYAQFQRPETPEELLDVWFENFFCLEQLSEGAY